MRPIEKQELQTTELEGSLNAVQRWVEDRDYKGYEPFDGLSSWFRPLAFGNILAERLLMQAIRQSPVNLRPLAGVQPKESTKGRGYMAWGYLILFRVTHDEEYLSKAATMLNWLDRHKIARFRYHSWANHFDFVSRGGRYTKDDPIIVWTSLIGHAFLEAFEITRQEQYLQVAESVCNWIMELPREHTNTGDCISYLPDVQSSIHNANMLGAAVLARTAAHLDKPNYFEVAHSAMNYSCSRQLTDGSWWYAEDPKYHWVDNFHTGYNLDSLKYYIDATGKTELRANLRKGLQYFRGNFFEESGRPKYYDNRTYPVDIQCAAQAIDTLSVLSESDGSCIDLARRVAFWTIRNMQDRSGYFYYRQYPLVKAKIPMLHWGQATMFKALARLLYALKENDALDGSKRRPAVARGDLATL